MIFKYLFLLCLINWKAVSCNSRNVLPDRELIFCKLEWIPDSNGNSPDLVVAYSTDDIVIRMNISGNMYPGRLTPELGLAFASIPATGAIHTSTEYEVLTNPRGCQVDWIDSSNDDFKETGQTSVRPAPLNRVLVANNGTPLYIGRAHMISTSGTIEIVGGAVTDMEGLSVSFEEKEAKTPEYQVLTSNYDLIESELIQFTFHPDDIDRLAPNNNIVLGSNLINNKVSTETVNTLQHSGSSEERFEIREDLFHWSGISMVNITLSHWFGSAVIQQSTTIESDDNFAVILNTIREIATTQQVKVGPSESVQICSSAEISSGRSIRFKAIGIFKGGPYMRVSAIKEILEASGRTVTLINGNSVEVLIEGTITGRFVVGIKTVTVNGSGGDACSKVLQY